MIEDNFIENNPEIPYNWNQKMLKCNKKDILKYDEKNEGSKIFYKLRSSNSKRKRMENTNWGSIFVPSLRWAIIRNIWELNLSLVVSIKFDQINYQTWIY